MGRRQGRGGTVLNTNLELDDVDGLDDGLLKGLRKLWGCGGC